MDPNADISARVSHSILHRPGTRLCVGTADDIKELEDVLAARQAEEVQRATTSGNSPGGRQSTMLPPTYALP